jgi:acetyl-CoA synthetase
MAAQDALARIARAADLRLVGPNTTGFANLVTGAHCGFAEFPHGYRPSRSTVAIVSQSGAMGLGLSQAAEHGVSISHVLTAGNSADVDVADFLAALAVEPEVHAVAFAFEGIASPERLEEAARAVIAAGKPVAAIKLGRSAAGAAAARWHTASETGEAGAWSNLFARCGIVEVADLGRLIETASFLAKTADLPRPSATPAIAILSSSGGMGILAADAAARHGITTPQPSDETARALAANLPSFGSPRNPCDATAQATSNPESLVRCADALLAEPCFDALVLPWGKAWVSPSFEALSEVAASRGKPLCLVWMSQWLEGPGAVEAERLEHVSVFRSLDSCMAALRAWARGGD